MDKFIKCPGMLKYSLIEKFHKNAYKIDNNIYAFFIKDAITIAKWKDDLTITMSANKNDIFLELWKSGKRIKAKRWSGSQIEEEFGLLSSCIHFYELEDYIYIESQEDADLKEFIF